MLQVRTSPILTTAAIALCALLSYEAIAGPGGLFADSLHRPGTPPREVTAAAELLPSERATVAIFEKASPSVVHIETTELRRQMFSRRVSESPQGTGSGFVWNDDGYIVTNYHVVRGSERIFVSGNNFTRVQAQVVGYDQVTDLAVVKLLEPQAALSALPVGSSYDLRVGQNVYAIGNPFGLDQTLTTGVISGLDREILSVSGTPIHGVVQTDAAINPGNSGGPLMDSSGRLIGVYTAIHSPSGASAGVGFAVPVDTVNRVVPQIISKGQPDRPTLGVWLVPDRWTYERGIPGVLLSEVRENGPAWRAGLRGLTQTSDGKIRLGDSVIAINGRPVRTQDEFRRQLSSYPPGEVVQLIVERDGEQREVSVELETFAEGQ